MNILKKLIASYNARVVQPRMTKNFEKTKYGKKISELKDKYKGRRCFLIGNGPSLRAEDLTALHEKGEITFAFNRIYNIFDQTNWRPTFYISQDEKMLAGCVDIVSELDLPFKFIPIQLKWYYNIDIQNAILFNLQRGQELSNGLFNSFSYNVAEQLFDSDTVMYTAAQFAAYMGFKEIYLLGVDHHFQISQNNKGEIFVDNSVKDYFSDKYNEDKDKLYIPNLENSTLNYIAMKHHCDKLGIKVFNATRGGKLEVFERVDFDKVVYIIHGAKNG